MKTLDEKLGQMLMVGFRGATPHEAATFIAKVRRFHIGGIWLTDADSPMGRVPGNVRSPSQLAELTAAIKQAASTPPFIAIDAEGGQVIRLKEQYGFPAFPSPQAIGTRDDTAFTRQEAMRIAETLKHAGINFNLAPVVDLNTNPANPVIGGRGRSLAGDAATVTRHAETFIRTHHEFSICCALKHFPGHGSSTTDSHLGCVDVTATWSQEELAPYRNLIANGLADSILSAHVFIRSIDPEHPGTLSKPILTGLLREQMGFDGVILSDDMNMGAVTQHYEPAEALALAIEAGVDIVVHGNVTHYDEQIVEKTLGHMHQLVETGRITSQRIDESYQRIMRLKQRFLQN